MEEIEVGEFARTTDGIIGIIENYDNGEYQIRHSDIDIWKCSEDYIVKHSKNIIDLIEVGDYVNNCYVLHTAEETDLEQCNGIDHKAIIINNGPEVWKDFGWKLIDFEIEEILTKEFYKKYCYKIPEKSSDIN